MTPHERDTWQNYTHLWIQLVEKTADHNHRPSPDTLSKDAIKFAETMLKAYQK